MGDEGGCCGSKRLSRGGVICAAALLAVFGGQCCFGGERVIVRGSAGGGREGEAGGLVGVEDRLGFNERDIVPNLPRSSDAARCSSS